MALMAAPFNWGNGMPKISKWVTETVTEITVDVFGWFICLAVLVAFFDIGRRSAAWLGWAESPDTIGLLSAVAAVWLYEHRRMEDRWDKTRGWIDRLAEQIHEVHR